MMETGQSTEPIGDIADVFQEEVDAVFPHAVVAVKIDSPVQVHTLPSASGGMRSYTLAAADQPKKVGGDDRRRRSVVLMSNQIFYVGIDQNSVATRYAAWWPANVPLTITHSEEVWVQPLADGIVSVVTEMWAS